MPFNLIIMPYKENCKAEGEILTRFKVARLHFAYKQTQKDIARHIRCHKNTVYAIVRLCKEQASDTAMKYLCSTEKINLDILEKHFSFLEHKSRAPHSHSRSLSGEREQLVLTKHNNLGYGPKRMHTHLGRQGYDTEEQYTYAKIRGIYRRNELETKKIRTVNGERRSLYHYESLGAFEELQYDTKHIADQHSLPSGIYDLFKHRDDIPGYQWTIVDAKTRIRFLAWSYTLSSTYGLLFLLFVVHWLRAHMIRTDIRVQIDGGPEMCSGSKRKLKRWNEVLARFGASVYDTEGSMWRQNLVERTHRIDDEEFYCPRGSFIDGTTDFLYEAQRWIVEYNRRSSQAKGLDGCTPEEKLSSLGIYNAERLCAFPGLILDDFFLPMHRIFRKKSQNVLTYYLLA